MIKGRCLCGDVTFHTDAVPIVTSACWCRVCQYLGAGSGTVNVAIPRDGLVVTGKLSNYASVADSGSHMNRSFCPRCGTPMFSEAEERPNLVFIRVGTLCDPSLMQPSKTIWAGAAPRWACLDPNLAIVAGQAPPV